MNRRDSEHSRPWQVDWKDPTWSRLEPSPTTTKNVKGAVIDVSAAQVLAVELLQEAPELCKCLGVVNPHDNDRHWLLTVTLLHPSVKLSDPPVASEVLLELADCDSEKIVYSRSLIWPETMETYAENERPQEKGSLFDLSAFIMPWRQIQCSADAMGGMKPVRGLVAAALCRQPLTKEAKENEALEVISAMLIGLDNPRGTAESDAIDKGPATSLPTSKGRVMKGHDEQSEETWEDNEAPIDPLCLACVSSQGLICIYSIWDLLSTFDAYPGAGKSSGLRSLRPVPEEEQAVISWLLGADVFDRLESTWLPLSQPSTTISLSILNDTQTTNYHSDYKVNGDKATGPGTGRVGLTSWNPWIEASTLQYRTVLNRVTSIHLVSPNFPFLVLLGQGVRLMGRPDTGSEALKVEKSVSFEKLGSTPEPVKMQDEWWKEQDETDSSTSGSKEDRSSSQQKRPTHENTGSGMSVNGGFVTLCSMASWAESRTLFLDFPPISVTYIERWHGMQLLLCLGSERAAAIRLDSVPATVLVGMDEDLERMFRTEEGYPAIPSQHPSLHVSRFAVLPVDLPSPMSEQAMTISRRILCADATTTPSLQVLYTESDDSCQKEMGLLAMPKFVGISAGGVIITSTENSAVARLPARGSGESARSLLESSWGHLGQGWSLFGNGNHTFFLCWEGATASRGLAFMQELEDSPKQVPPFSSTTTVLFPSRNRANRDQDSVQSIVHSENGATSNPTMQERNSTADTAHRTFSVDDLTLDESGVAETNYEISAPTLQQRREKMLQRVSSWTELEDSDERRARLARKLPVVALRSMIRDDSEDLSLHVLKMRQVVIENGAGSPFSQVLRWLSQNHDYFTAASIALDMLRDSDTLYHLWKNAEKIDEEDEQSKLHGLLDGIIPIDISDRPPQTQGSTTLRHLADMTVGCLIKGGLDMSRTLSRFLHYNKDYDPERASLMLVAAAVGTLSGDMPSVASVMGSEEDKFSIHDVLWPVECLLEVAIERDYLPSTLALLNANIPDELRCRSPPAAGDAVESSSNLELTKSLLTMIISKSSRCVDLLLALPNDDDSSTFWASLDSVTQRSLLLICVGGRYPMLLHEEVREWALHQLQGGLHGKNVLGPSTLRTEWLQELVPACLLNAGCNLSDFVFEPSNVSMTSFNSEASSTWVDLECDGEDGLYQLKLQIIETRVALEPSPGSTGIDFDILISALLLLESRQARWNENEDRCVSTQGLLDAACHLAGRPRPKTEGPRFSLDGAALMQLCTVYDNVRAGANLIGGKNGFILGCCSILMLNSSFPIEKVESFFLQESLDLSLLGRTNETSQDQHDFQLTDSHRRLLWLLDERVLSVRTFGDFEVELSPQGRVDPVFAARSIFRAWLYLTESCKRKGSQWVSEWLRGRLGLQKKGSSVHRLACAAISRALLWSGTDEYDESSNDATTDQRLGRLLEMDTYFLIQLAQASCGLVESVPPTIADDLINSGEATSVGDFQMNLTSTRRLRPFASRKS